MALVNPSRATGEIFGPRGQNVSFGFITDTHHDPVKETDSGKYYQDSEDKITDIVALINADTSLDFVFQNGDFIDGSADESTALSDLSFITNILDGCNIPVYHNIGNHELWQLTKAQTMAVTGQTSKYYSFVNNGVTFIVLDGNYTADDDSADLEVSSGGSPSPYVSYVPPVQRAWLTNTIETSPYPCVILCHYPVYYVGAESWGLSNAADVREILENAGNKIICCIGGHLHDNFIRELNGILYVNLHAIVSGAYPSLNYSTITVYPNTREVKVVSLGKQMSYISTEGLSDVPQP